MQTSIGVAWGDYDNDGYPDLFVSNEWDQNNSLYRNNGDGTFTKVTDGPVVNDHGSSRGCSWGDYDNDGFLDLFVADHGWYSSLYHNNGDGTFTKITGRSIVQTPAVSNGASWGDYDNDGYIDLLVANDDEANFLYHNDGNGNFERVFPSGLLGVGMISVGVAWGDYDNDGRLDVFVANGNNTAPEPSLLYHNLGQGNFQRVTDGNVATDENFSFASAWGDYDNDGFLDLFLASNGTNSLFHNNGDGTFTKITGPPAGNGNDSLGCAWADYDNDGYLDLFVARWNGSNTLYHNNGDGTFTPFDFPNPNGDPIGCAWADYDKDGFLDLVVASGIFSGQGCLLFHNEGNTNRWIQIKCIGAASNRAALGTKIRLKATIAGKERWQLRQIASGDCRGGDLEAHFGLGDAVKVEMLRIEWPSGHVQELYNLGVNQFLTVTEPPSLKLVLSPIPLNVQLELTGVVGRRYDLEFSTDLAQWQPWLTVTNTTRTISIEDWGALFDSIKFYRAIAH